MKKIVVALALVVAVMSSCGELTQQKEQPQEIKNVIFMIGDGMGLAQVSQLMIEGGYAPTAFDGSANVALIKTYSANNRVTDSAAAGTALATGKKTNNKMIGLTAELDTCTSIAVAAQQMGMATGLVATCVIQHATPAAFYAHVDDRDDYEQISRQLVASDIDLVIGGGEQYFAQEVEGGTLMDVALEKGFAVARTFDELDSVGDAPVLGLFAQGHLPAMSEGRGDYLPKATAAALERLSKNESGFFLMVEGSQIDWECHANDAEGTLAETLDFNDAVAVAMEFADQNPGTLLVVTADHETGGLSVVSNDADFKKGDSGVAYKYSTGSHSGILVPVYIYGTGAEQIGGVMENTDLSDKLRTIINK